MPHRFVRIHRTHLVNTGYLRRFNNSGAIEIELTNGEQFTVARRKKRDFLQAMQAKRLA